VRQLFEQAADSFVGPGHAPVIVQVLEATGSKPAFAALLSLVEARGGYRASSIGIAVLNNLSERLAENADTVVEGLRMRRLGQP
jgi:hypothetical protein